MTWIKIHWDTFWFTSKTFSNTITSMDVVYLLFIIFGSFVVFGFTAVAHIILIIAIVVTVAVFKNEKENTIIMMVHLNEETAAKYEDMVMARDMYHNPNLNLKNGGKEYQIV